MIMKSYRITSGGQVAVPASIRRRWRTSKVAMEDLGDRLVVRPVPEDPIAAFRGSLAGKGLPSSAQMREEARADEIRAEDARDVSPPAP